MFINKGISFFSRLPLMCSANATHSVKPRVKIILKIESSKVETKCYTLNLKGSNTA